MRLLAGAAVGLWLAVAGYFFWNGITSIPSENDSLMWHIPIAESILKGKLWGKNLYQSPYGYYPAAGEVVLAGLMVLKIPLNLYNWIGWLALFWVMRALGIRRGLGRELATVLAASLVFLPTVMRLFPTQLVDVWLCVWWGWLLWLLEKPQKSLKYWVALGLAAGMTAGTKYTGLVLTALAFAVYSKGLIKAWNVRGGVWAGIIILLIGGFWYVRNWIVWNDPLYPQNFLWFRGYQPYQLPIVWKDLLLNLRGWGLLIQAVFSEYLIWGGLILLPFFYRRPLVWMGMIILGMYLILPGDARTVVSNLRYVLPGFMALMLTAGEYFIKKKKEEWLGTVALVNAVSVLPQLDYHPKIWLVFMCLWMGWWWRQKHGKNYE